MNDAAAPLGYGDHIGDWEFYKVFLDRSNPQDLLARRRVEWHAHGMWPCSASWDITNGWWHHSDATRVEPWPDFNEYHLPIYIEGGTHGLWPTRFEYCLDYVVYTWCARLNGDGVTYLPESIPNLGEVYRPRLGMETILQYNGLWGFSDSPDGPVLHEGRWQHSPTGNYPAAYAGKWGIAWSGIIRDGRISHPCTQIEAVVKAVETGGKIIAYPGNYNEAFTITKSCTITAPHGAVIIGE